MILFNLINKYFKILYDQLKNDLDNYRSKKSGDKCNPKNFNEIVNQEAIFVLSTGRCGTNWLTELLKKSRLIKVEHDPLPKIYFQSQFIYKNNFDKNVIFSSFIHARYQYLFDDFCLKKKYVETNNRISFYAQAIAEEMPNARFVHIVRHPYEVIRSGMRRGWYGELNSEFSGHIVPREDDLNFKEWNDYSQEQKIAWLWKRTNEIIEDIKFKIDSERIITITSSDMFNNEASLKQLLQFIGADDLLSRERMLKKFQNKLINNQCKGVYPEIKQWKKETLSEIKAVLNNTNLYNFKL